MTDRTVAEPQKVVAIERAAVTPMSLIEMAVAQKADVDKLEKLLELHLRWEANEAKKAFVKAMKAFKETAPAITKNKGVSYQNSKGQTVAYRHATLDNVCDSIEDDLSKYGLAHRWKMTQDNGRIRVTCVITHEQGHSEETSLEAGPDDSGGKNSIQAIASTVTYLERYTLLAATGLAAENTDNDGAGTPQFEKLQEFLDAMSTAPNLNVLETTFKGAYKEATAAKDPKALVALIEAKNARKKQLAAEAQ
jgi:hypothetical protein